MTAGNDMLTEEIEALKYIFDESELEVVRADPVEIAVQIDPEPSPSGLQFVHACLLLRTSPNYPDAAVQCSLQDVKGLGDRRTQELVEMLHRESQDMVGEMALGHLCNAAKEEMTQMNQPEDTCALCLEELRDGGPSEEGLVVLACYHCFHKSCFGRWYLAAQKGKKSEREQAIQDYKHAATADFLAQAGLQTHQHGLFAVPCPVCRKIIDPGQFKVADLVQFKSASAASQSSSEGALGLQGPALDQLRQMQARHKILYAQQLAKNGIVSEKYAVHLS